MDYFKNLVTLGLLDMSSRVEALTLRFCFLHLIRRDLNRMSSEWNAHRICSNRHAEAVAGKPDVLYFSPGVHGAQDYRKEFNAGQMHGVLDTLENAQDFDDHPTDYIQFLTAMKGNVPIPQTMDEARLLFSDIVHQVRTALA